MIEQRIADRFLAAVADEPPLGFDPDDVVERAKRRQRRRLAMAATPLATGGVVLASVAVFAASTPGQVGTAAPGDPVATTTSENAPKPPDTPVASPDTVPGDKHESVQPPYTPPSFPGSDAVVANLGKVIPVVLAEKVPGLKFGKPDSDILMVAEDQRAVGGAYRVDGTKHRYVTIFVAHDKDALDLAGDKAAGGGWGPLVSDTIQSDGSHLRIYRHEGDGEGGILVVHLRVDGVIVQADTTAKTEPGQQGFAVNEEVLTALATDARLTF